MSLETWGDIGIVCGSLVLLWTVIGLTSKGVRRMWQLLRKVNRLLDQTLGEPPEGNRPGRPSLMDRVEAIETNLDKHLDWHANPGGRPAGGAPVHPNGPGRQPPRKR